MELLELLPGTIPTFLVNAYIRAYGLPLTFYSTYTDENKRHAKLLICIIIRNICFLVFLPSFEGFRFFWGSTVCILKSCDKNVKSRSIGFLLGMLSAARCEHAFMVVELTASANGCTQNNIIPFPFWAYLNWRREDLVILIEYYCRFSVLVYSSTISLPICEWVCVACASV